MDDYANWRPGVLNKSQITHLCNIGKIKNVEVSTIEDPSSFDLHLTDDVYQLKGCVKPDNTCDISSLRANFQEKRLNFDSNEELILNKSSTYIFRVKETINFSGTELCGQATGKSTFGRLDILTRLLVSRNDKYDFINLGYNGSLWVEVTPITFSVKIKKGMSLNQLRIFKGSPDVSRIINRNLHLWGDLIFDDTGHKIEDRNIKENLSLSLKEDPKLGKSICAYKAKILNDDGYIDLTKDVKNGSYLNKSNYWDEITPTYENPLSLEIDPEKFFILRSKERFKLPRSVAVYCKAVTETLGELRIHYAGFVHPYFGVERKDDMGAPLIFEVRGHNIKAFLQHGETLANLEYYSMSEDAEKYNASYTDQELTLSKYFSK